MFFIASPNNPDGSMLTSEMIDELLSLPTLIVLDEAYIEFADEHLGADSSRIRERALTRKPRRPSHLQQMGGAGRLADRIRCISALADAHAVEIQTAV